MIATQALRHSKFRDRRMMERREIAVYDGSNLTDPAAPASARNAPEIVKCVGKAAEFAREEFFPGELAKPHTRKNVVRAARRGPLR